MQYKEFTDNYIISIQSGNVWVRAGRELIIGDIFLNDGCEQTFFQEIIYLAKELGLGNISFQVCSNCSLHSLFVSKYKAIPSFPVLFKDLGSGLPLEKIKFTFADIDIF